MVERVITAEQFIQIVKKGYPVEDRGEYPWEVPESLTIENYRVSGEVLLDAQERICNNIRVSNVVFEHVVRLRSRHVQWFGFLSCQFQALVIEQDFLPRSVGNNQIGLLRLEKYKGDGHTLVGYPAERIILVGTTVTSDIASGLRPKNVLEFEDCDLQNLTIRRGSEEENGLFEKLGISNCRVPDRLTISGWHLDWMQLSEVEVGGSIRIEFCDVAHLHLDNLQGIDATVDFAHVSFITAQSKAANENSAIKSSSSLLLLESRLGELRWSFCDWSSVQMFIDDIVIRKVWLQGSSTPRRISPVNNQWKEVVDLFGLFEANARVQGHTADAISNKANALRAYRTYLSKQGRDPMDRVTLWLSEVVSDYGANWVKALSVLFSTGLALFLLLLAVADERVAFFCVDTSTPRFVLNYTVHFLEFLSPLHAANFLDLELNGWSRIIDIVARVWLGFVIYQLVRSTRKFVS